MGTSDQISATVAVAAVLPVFDAVKSMSLKPLPREMHLTNLAMTSLVLMFLVISDKKVHIVNGNELKLRHCHGSMNRMHLQILTS